jgi:hypothetical protein
MFVLQFTVIYSTPGPLRVCHIHDYVFPGFFLLNPKYSVQCTVDNVNEIFYWETCWIYKDVNFCELNKWRKKNF